MKYFITIETNSFISFLQLFNKNNTLESFEFGETRYKREGFVDGKIFNGLNRIEDILNFDYDFPNPVIFIARIDEMDVEFINNFHAEYYKVYGEDFKLRVLINKMIELNAYNPESYVYSEIRTLYNII